ncbi:hypothetical protein KC356_g69 [Hortaea werneckii]|nr:hypothetical protein KC356_g69 [Hortaea werneckii]
MSQLHDEYCQNGPHLAEAAMAPNMYSLTVSQNGIQPLRANAKISTKTALFPSVTTNDNAVPFSYLFDVDPCPDGPSSLDVNTVAVFQDLVIGPQIKSGFHDMATRSSDAGPWIFICIV